jgi:hypothetical protein
MVPGEVGVTTSSKKSAPATATPFRAVIVTAALEPATSCARTWTWSPL